MVLLKDKLERYRREGGGTSDTADVPKVISRGLSVYFPQPASREASAVGEAHGLSLEEHQAQELDLSEIDENTLILTMTEGHKSVLTRYLQGFEGLYTVREFAGETGDVTDPYGGSMSVYEACFSELDRLMIKVVERLL